MSFRKTLLFILACMVLLTWGCAYYAKPVDSIDTTLSDSPDPVSLERHSKPHKGGGKSLQSCP